jgi:copper ion binding protein
MEHTTIAVNGMSCGHCVAAVKKALEELSGVEVEQVSIGSVTVSYDPESVSVEQIAEAVRNSGYEPMVGAGH